MQYSIPIKCGIRLADPNHLILQGEVGSFVTSLYEVRDECCLPTEPVSGWPKTKSWRRARTEHTVGSFERWHFIDNVEHQEIRCKKKLLYFLFNTNFWSASAVVVSETCGNQPRKRGCLTCVRANQTPLSAHLFGSFTRPSLPRALNGCCMTD